MEEGKGFFAPPGKGPPPIPPPKKSLAGGSIGPAMVASGGISGADLDPKFCRQVFHGMVVRYLEALIKGIDHDSLTDRAWILGHIEAYRSLEILNEQEYKTWLFNVDAKCPVKK